MTVEVNGIATVGDVLAGKYRVDKILGVGGMGMVVAATHLELDQRVALKFMLPSMHESQETPARFLREARAAGRLNSDHVCRVIDVGRFDGGTPYIVMEYLQGEDLGAMLRRRGPQRVSDAVGYILQAIEGIAEAHANGIIHRDLKPDNLFLHKRNDGATIVKVLDFGISKAKAAGLSTKTGDIFGSPAYMAPEQMESSRSVDHRADVWSLGIVLYQLVVGKLPFQADSLPLLCMSVVNDEPKLMSEIRGDLPDGFEAVVMKCLRKEPTERYADVGELAHALAPFGPKNATTSASRIQIVLRRIHVDSSSVISTEFATVEREDPSVPAARETPVLHKARMVGSNVSSLPSIPSLASRIGPPDRRRSRRLVGALVAAIAAVSAAILVVWRSGATDGAVSAQPSAEVSPAATPAAPAATPAAAPGTAPPPPQRPIVEPIDEPSAANRAARPIVEPIDEPPTADRAAPTADRSAPTADRSTPTADRSAPTADRAAPTAPAARDRPPVGSPKAEIKKRKPYRPVGATPPRVRPGPGSAAADAKTGSNAGSAAPPDDDKWMHMTHDDKKP